jgi:hypothetical protein
MVTGGCRSQVRGVSLVIEHVDRVDHLDGLLTFNITNMQARDLLDTLHELLDPVEGEENGKVRTTDSL